MYSILQMPGGIPVATVAIGGGLNAGLLAAQILAISDEKINKQISQYRDSLKESVIAKQKFEEAAEMRDKERKLISKLNEAQ